MRRCHFCHERFFPPAGKPCYRWCSWSCRFLEDQDGATKEAKAEAKARAKARQVRVVQPPREPRIPAELYRGMLQLCHPDKWANNAAMLPVAEEVTKWLLEHRPKAIAR